jgi:hypothetical protein
VKSPERVVFDCGVYFQALIAPSGPAGKCFAAATDGCFSESANGRTNRENCPDAPRGRGGYRFSDYLRVGVPLDLLFIAVTIALTPYVFPFYS